MQIISMSFILKSGICITIFCIEFGQISEGKLLKVLLTVVYIKIT